ncbi:dihydropteroate synthase [Limimaricola pyoseonensis]|uniref:Dihydropteroate synthase n=1 Tax=Limimaricola pyoseonensis TaxID=521013 RepID=A0A1G7D4P4_9RHOB|nr:dihydropteroate synthase [Limimaricola pyoseonensis]SDE46463.1 Dihydropteroate synthase [Limimaricola pyoseonensis]
MSRPPAPLPLWPIGPERGLPLAGIAGARFSEALGADGQLIAAADLAPDLQGRLSARRPDLCGLPLDRPRIMGILNVTPDSFSDGGDHARRADALARARALVAEGAEILDIGGESTRPGAQAVPVAEEIARVVPLVAELRAAGLSTPISVDTRKAEVARAALAEGADMVNDVSALGYDPDLAHVVAEAGVPLCLMHAKGSPAEMQDAPRYSDVTAEVWDMLEARIRAAQAAGIDRAKLLVDPGIGFGKDLQHNLTLLRALPVYHGFGLPLLLGVSRKRFIGTIADVAAPKDRVPGSVAVALAAAQQGVHVLRVHDVSDTRQALRLHRAMMGQDE